LGTVRRLAFTAGSAEAPEAQLAAILDVGQEVPGTGRVILVGAGPGDAELLTLKAVRALQSADVILYDDLVRRRSWELGRREAERVWVGKRGGQASCRQDEINALLLRLALAGKRVVRLKSGDPMVFGPGRRGDRPAAGRGRAGRGRAWDHRSPRHGGSARRVPDPSRHRPFGPLRDRPWPPRRASPTTSTGPASRSRDDLDRLYGGRTASLLAARLTAAGLAPDTPAAASAAISKPDEARWSGPLAGLARGVAALGEEQPILIGVGHVFAELGSLGHRRSPGFVTQHVHRLSHPSPAFDQSPAAARCGSSLAVKGVAVLSCCS
jgi:uroporphyrin-III C-methyltransferase/precorrin-2 dehydrogenase/sirohydrochlorin ferrochelatase